MLLLSIVLVGCCTPIETIIQPHIIPPIDITDTLDYVWLQGYKIGLNAVTGTADTIPFGYMYGESSKSNVKVDTVSKKIYFKGRTDTIKVMIPYEVPVVKPTPPAPLIIAEKHNWFDWLKVGALGFFIGVIVLFALKKLGGLPF